MKARIKGFDESFKEIETLTMKGVQGTYFVDDVEFEQQREQTIEIPFGAKDSELQEAIYYIPEGYGAEINGNKVTIKKCLQKIKN